MKKNGTSFNEIMNNFVLPLNVDGKKKFSCHRHGKTIFLIFRKCLMGIVERFFNLDSGVKLDELFKSFFYY